MGVADIEVEVIGLVAAERGIARDKVRLSTRLLHDLGMDGDDAVDFFNTIHKRFGTDLTNLDMRWNEHFGPEGFSCWSGMAFIPAALVGGVVAETLDLSAVWGLGIATALLTLWFWTVRDWRPPARAIPITIADVVAAVEAGAWPAVIHAPPD